MKRLLAIALVLGVTAATGVALFAAYMLSTYSEAPVDPAWAVEGSRDIPPGSVTVRYTGTATLVFADGATTWMTDGWFSRPGPLAMFTSDIAPDLDAIERGLARNEVTRADAVFPVHSHYDHAMDAPEVARRTGALLLGSESTANIGRGWGLPEAQIRVVEDREPIRVGRFVITPIVSQHFQFPDPTMRERALSDPEITEPLVPPVKAFAYKLGIPYVLHVAHPSGTALVVGSAGYREGDLEGWSADVVFLGTGGLGSQTEAYREAYWRETIGATKPSRIIPIHWDSLTGKAEGPFTGPVRAAWFLSRGTDVGLSFLQEKAAANPKIQFMTLPRFEPVVLF